MMMIVDMQVVWMSALIQRRELEAMDENDEWSDTESLAELEGDELGGKLAGTGPSYGSQAPKKSQHHMMRSEVENPKIQFHKV